MRERPDIDAFLEEIITVCERRGFGLGLGHEDTQDRFKIVSLADFDRDCLLDAADCTVKPVTADEFLAWCEKHNIVGALELDGARWWRENWTGLQTELRALLARGEQ